MPPALLALFSLLFRFTSVGGIESLFFENPSWPNENGFKIFT
jgi:hypothetical protein